MMNMKCICCAGNIKSFLTIDNMPSSAQNIPTAENLFSDQPLSLSLCQCETCGLVQLAVEPVSYYKDAIRAGGGTSTMRSLRIDEYTILIHYMNQYGINKDKIIEVGCGQGEFLKMWRDCPEASGIHVIGLENKKELVQKAQEQGLDVYYGFAENDYSFPNGPFDAFVQFNFLEHQPDPVGMLKCIWRNLKENAVGLITVPSFEYIIENDGYYELLRDHIANYTFETLENVLSLSGFIILDKRIVNRDTIEVIVKKGKVGTVINPFSNEFVDISSLKQNYEEMIDEMEQYHQYLQSNHRTMAIWGASHQGFTLAATTKLGDKAKYIIDSAEFKQGKYSPVSHLPIVPSSHFHSDPVDEVLIVAPGYTDEIAQIIRREFGENITIRVLMDRKMRVYE